jgi:hypothetical protein
VSINPAVLSEKEMEQVTSIAREKVSAEIKDLTESEIQIIKTEQPKYSYYKLSGNYADYSFFWNLKDNQKVVVSGRGDILTLEGAKVQKINK